MMLISIYIASTNSAAWRAFSIVADEDWRHWFHGWHWRGSNDGPNSNRALSELDTAPHTAVALPLLLEHRPSLLHPPHPPQWYSTKGSQPPWLLDWVS